MKRIIVCLLTGLLAVGMMAGCSKKLTPEEQAASEAAVLAQQLQEEETQTGNLCAGGNDPAQNI